MKILRSSMYSLLLDSVNDRDANEKPVKAASAVVNVRLAYVY